MTHTEEMHGLDSLVNAHGFSTLLALDQRPARVATNTKGTMNRDVTLRQMRALARLGAEGLSQKASMLPVPIFVGPAYA